MRGQGTKDTPIKTNPMVADSDANSEEGSWQRGMSGQGWLLSRKARRSQP